MCSLSKRLSLLLTDGEHDDAATASTHARFRLSFDAGDAAVDFRQHVAATIGIDVDVARTTPDGFAVSFILSKRRRTMLTEQLMLLTNRPFADGLEDRRTSPRHHQSNARAICRLADGTSLCIKIINMSVDGVSVDAPRRPPIGSEIHVGRASGVIVRHTPRGFIVVYEVKTETQNQILRAI